jgi:dTDP-glucose 4,6-dehydratase
MPTTPDAQAELPTLLVTGGAGFIGSALVRLLMAGSEYRVVTLDALTYAGNLDSLHAVAAHPRHHFVRGSIGDAALVRELFDRHDPAGVIHLAAESQVDRSIDGPGVFVETNVAGTMVLLQEARRHHERRAREGRPFRFLHVSTDEVFGSLEATAPAFTDASPYAPRSPYAATKAASDHLVRAWGHTYGLPVVITNCSNNYGPYQFPEKLIPLMILRGLAGEALPVYGSGANVRDWLHVDDHARALVAAFTQGEAGATYLVGGNAEHTNLEVVQLVCDLLDARLGRAGDDSTHRQITFVSDRPGHDLRYAIDATATRDALGWLPSVSFGEGLARTVDWYLTHRDWWERVLSGAYRMERLGLEAHGTEGAP